MATKQPPRPPQPARSEAPATDPALPGLQPDPAVQADPVAQVDPAVQVLRRFRSVFNAVKTHFQQVEKQAGVGGAQLWALSVIQAQPDIGVGGLAQAMDIHQTTASNLVKTMVKGALVLVTRDNADRRSTQLRLTAAGAQVLARAPGPFTGVLPEALAALDAHTLARLDSDLGTLLNKLQADERAAGIPLAQM